MAFQHSLNIRRVCTWTLHGGYPSVNYKQSALSTKSSLSSWSQVAGNPLWHVTDIRMSSPMFFSDTVNYIYFHTWHVISRDYIRGHCKTDPWNDLNMAWTGPGTGFRLSIPFSNLPVVLLKALFNVSCTLSLYPTIGLTLGVWHRNSRQHNFWAKTK